MRSRVSPPLRASVSAMADCTKGPVARSERGHHARKLVACSAAKLTELFTNRVCDRHCTTGSLELARRRHHTVHAGRRMRTRLIGEMIMSRIQDAPAATRRRPVPDRRRPRDRPDLSRRRRAAALRGLRSAAHDEGPSALRAYYRALSRRSHAANGTGFILESPTWRASADWGEQARLFEARRWRQVNRDVDRADARSCARATRRAACRWWSAAASARAATATTRAR